MAVLEYKHKNKGFTIKVDTRRGKPIVTNLGMINIIGVYKGCRAVQEEIFHESFEVMA